MKVNVDYEEAVMSIDEMIENLPKQLRENEKVVLRKIGALVRGKVVQFLHDSGVEVRAKQIAPSNYDGTRPYVHMKDDVQYAVKKDKQGNLYVSVKGGKYTGYKWAPVDVGHIARDGTTYVPGLNFVGRAGNASEGEVEKLIDDMLKKVAEK